MVGVEIVLKVKGVKCRGDLTSSRLQAETTTSEESFDTHTPTNHLPMD
jgi:hypothetical protein